MRYNYSADDFNGNNVLPETIEETIERKINLLKDGFHLNKNDEREPVVRAILAQCKTATEINNVLHSVVRFEKTLDEFIAQRGV